MFVSQLHMQITLLKLYKQISDYNAARYRASNAYWCACFKFAQNAGLNYSQLLHLLISPCSNPASERAPLLQIMAIFVATIKHSLSETSSTRGRTAASFNAEVLVVSSLQLDQLGSIIRGDERCEL